MRRRGGSGLENSALGRRSSSERTAARQWVAVVGLGTSRHTPAVNLLPLLDKGCAARGAAWLLVSLAAAGCSSDESNNGAATTPVTVGMPTTTMSGTPTATTTTPTMSTTVAPTTTQSMTGTPTTPSQTTTMSTGTVPTPPVSTSTPTPTMSTTAGPTQSMTTTAPTMSMDPSVGGGGGGGNPMETGGAGGMGPDLPIGPIVPTKSGNTYSIVVGDVTLKADGPSGRITGLALGGTELLLQKGAGAESTDTNYGSSFWTSPQSDWGWPPPADVDNVYTHALDAASNTVTLSSAEFALTSGPTLKVNKALSGDAAKQAFVLDYTIENTGTGAVNAAPWEITRVASAGFGFYPQGAAAPVAAPNEDEPYEEVSTEIADGVVWYDFDATDARAKSVGDGAEGWLAFVNDDYVYVKQFPDIGAGDSAPGHYEVEVYSDPENEYIELEAQGAIGSIAAGATSASWQVHWYVRPLPTDIDTAKGSAELVEWVRTLIAQ